MNINIIIVNTKSPFLMLTVFSELKQLSSSQLTELFGEMESLVAALSETLIAELALRDELEFEKELKNQFISLLLAVQNRRRQHHVTKKRNQMQNGTSPLPQHRSLQVPKVRIAKYNLIRKHSGKRYITTWFSSVTVPDDCNSISYR